MLTEIVMVGNPMLTSRYALTTFSIAYDEAEYSAILSALFIIAYPAAYATLPPTRRRCCAAFSPSTALAA